MDALAPISLSTLGDTVTDRIRVAIIKGELLPGEKLSELNIATKLKVSRSPVREGLTRLEGEGLTIKETNHGFRVWSPTEKDIDEILSLRVMIETFAADLILNQLSEAHFKVLDEIYAKQVKAVQANDHLALTREDRNFHGYLIELTNHSRLIDTWMRLMGQWEVLVYQRIATDPVVSGTVLVDHKNILLALKAKDRNRLIELHKEINMRVSREMKAKLSIQKD